jgi:hypothetical protein
MARKKDLVDKSLTRRDLLKAGALCTVGKRSRAARPGSVAEWSPGSSLSSRHDDRGESRPRVLRS